VHNFTRHLNQRNLASRRKKGLGSATKCLGRELHQDRGAATGALFGRGEVQSGPIARTPWPHHEVLGYQSLQKSFEPVRRQRLWTAPLVFWIHPGHRRPIVTEAWQRRPRLPAWQSRTPRSRCHHGTSSTSAAPAHREPALKACGALSPGAARQSVGPFDTIGHSRRPKLAAAATTHARAEGATWCRQAIHPY
jgi:hypothetical protein